MASGFRIDIFLGAVYGLAAGAGLWAFVFSPPPLSVETVSLVVAALALGAISARSRRLGRLDWVLPCQVCGAVWGGLGTGMLLAAACAFGERALGPVTLRRTTVRSAGLGVAVATLAAGVAGTAHAGALAAGVGTVAALALDALAWCVVRVSLLRLAAGLHRPGARRRSASRPFRLAALAALGTAGGALWAAQWEQPLGRAVCVSLLLLALALALGNGRRERREMRRRARLESAALVHSVVRGLGRLIGARDPATLAHLQRVQRLCLEVGHRLGVPPAELEALAAGALLHDLGKIAVPDDILGKPGRLTAEEMARIKVHPEVGADVLDAIPFPFPVAPIVRHHHERWDGQGYPDGLRGEEIPVGARILTAVDSYDALTSDRPYRRALPHEEAVAFLIDEAGGAFDSEVVETLVEVVEGGFRAEGDPPPARAYAAPEDPTLELSPVGRLPRSRLELETLYEIEQARHRGLSRDEYLTLVSGKLQSLVPYRALVVYGVDPTEPILRAGFAIGEAAERLRQNTIPLGERLSGWCALQKRAMVGNEHRSPVDRDGFRSDLEDWGEGHDASRLGASLVAPMVLDERTVGVIALYDGEQRTFTADDRRILVWIAGTIASHAGEGPAALEDHSLTDPLTGVPNARFLRIEANHRMARGSGRFGLMAFRVHGMESVGERLGRQEGERLLCRIARRFAASCAESETPVRFGQDLFLVLTHATGAGELVERWHELSEDVEEPPLAAADGVPCAIRLSTAHAEYPDDGEGLDELLDRLDTRLSLAADGGRTIVPFRPRAEARRGRSA